MEPPVAQRPGLRRPHGVRQGVAIPASYLPARRAARIRHRAPDHLTGSRVDDGDDPVLLPGPVEPVDRAAPRIEDQESIPDERRGRQTAAPSARRKLRPDRSRHQPPARGYGRGRQWTNSGVTPSVSAALVTRDPSSVVTSMSNSLWGRSVRRR